MVHACFDCCPNFNHMIVVGKVTLIWECRFFSSLQNSFIIWSKGNRLVAVQTIYSFTIMHRENIKVSSFNNSENSQKK